MNAKYYNDFTSPVYKPDWLEYDVLDASKVTCPQTATQSNTQSTTVPLDHESTGEVGEIDDERLSTSAVDGDKESTLKDDVKEPDI